jgi:hypothetical protein
LAAFFLFQASWSKILSMTMARMTPVAFQCTCPQEDTDVRVTHRPVVLAIVHAMRSDDEIGAIAWSAADPELHDLLTLPAEREMAAMRDNAQLKVALAGPHDIEAHRPRQL